LHGGGSEVCGRVRSAESDSLTCPAGSIGVILFRLTTPVHRNDGHLPDDETDAAGMHIARGNGFGQWWDQLPRVSHLRSVTAQRCRQMAARSHRLVLSNTAPTIQPSLLMSEARPEAPPLGAGSVSVPPITGHFTGSPVSKDAPRFPTASPRSFTALAQAFVLGVVRPALPRTSVEATCQPPKHLDPAAHRPLHWIAGVEIRARAAYIVTAVVHHPLPGAGWPRQRRSA
jgi:hypothetical protein